MQLKVTSANIVTITIILGK